MPGMAATLTSLTAHGGLVTGPGCPTVLINCKPAARVGDMHMCPMVTPGTPPIPHVGGPITGPGCMNVLIGGMPAATMGDLAVCVGPPSTIVMGSPNVLIGTGGGGGGGGGGGSSSSQAAQALQSGALKPVKGSETFPIQIQAVILEAARHLTSEETEALVENTKKDLEKKKPTIADFVEVLEGVEREQGYEAARYFASTLDYVGLCDLARGFVSGQDPDQENDPNQMPTRFMILFGADDAKLRQIDDHPDRHDKEEHTINVANLRKALRLMGNDINETGPYDDEVYTAYVQYLGTVAGGQDAVYDEDAAVEYGDFPLTLEIDPNDPAHKNDTFTLYSSEAVPRYKQVKTVKDDTKPGDATLQLKFEKIDKSLKYTLEVDPGGTGKAEIVFKDRPFGKWA